VSRARVPGEQATRSSFCALAPKPPLDERAELEHRRGGLLYDIVRTNTSVTTLHYDDDRARPAAYTDAEGEVILLSDGCEDAWGDPGDFGG
jgi:hypothetical protein